MIIAIGSDHAGFKAKEYVKKVLEVNGYMPVDYGTHSEDSVDYPDFAVQVAEAVSTGQYEKGIAICGSGEGVCMTANKVDHIRAALAWNKDVAELSRKHNNANVLCLPGRFLSEEELKTIVLAWLKTEFEGGRHERRVNKIHDLTHH
ncbi:MAG TPA: ribose 5-phosphate isomerase B [Balneolales bacterium]|nr:ribose 5-phosphate isomerase B [Balneolales bacterium]